MDEAEEVKRMLAMLRTRRAEGPPAFDVKLEVMRQQLMSFAETYYKEVERTKNPQHIFFGFSANLVGEGGLDFIKLGDMHNLLLVFLVLARKNPHIATLLKMVLESLKSPDACAAADAFLKHATVEETKG